MYSYISIDLSFCSPPPNRFVDGTGKRKNVAFEVFANVAGIDVDDGVFEAQTAHRQWGG